MRLSTGSCLAMRGLLPVLAMVCGSLWGQALAAMPDAPGMTAAVSTWQSGGQQQQTGAQQQTPAQAASQGIEDAAKGTVRS